MRSADALGKALRGKLAGIMVEMGDFTLEEIESDDGLKSNILEDPLFSIAINSGKSFTVTANPRDICKSLLRDYHFGCARVRGQWESVQTLAENNFVAWALVSAYYCSFFGALEALRVCGTHLLSLSGEEAILAFSKVGGSNLEALLKERNFRGVVSSDFSKIGYTSTGDKPHQAIWQNLKSSVLPIVPKSNPSWCDIAKFKNICEGVRGWELPSDIRNRWNYRDPLYFGKMGKSSASPFLKLLSDNSAASSWIRANVVIRNEADSAASIASLAQFIQETIEDTYQYGFLSSKFLVQ